MQVVDYKRVVAGKTNFNLNVPSPLVPAFEQIVKDSNYLNVKQKWVAVSAALLLLVEQSDEVRSAFFGAVAQADATGGWDELIESVRNGDFRDAFYAAQRARKGPVKVAVVGEVSPNPKTGRLAEGDTMGRRHRKG